MRHLIYRYCLLLLLYTVLPYKSPAQQAKNYDRVEEFVRTFPLKQNTLSNLRLLMNEVSRKFTADDEKARAAFYWITRNIVYDCEGFRNGNGIAEINEVVEKRKAICAGYARLYKYLCDEMKLSCEVVSGFATGISVNYISADSLFTNHAWNAVKINKQWKLVDATWAAGSANSDCTKQYMEYNEFYFFSRPDSFILSHFPEDTAWQLLSKPLNPEEFASAAERERKLHSPLIQKDSLISKKVGELIRFRRPHLDERNAVYIFGSDEKGEKLPSVYDTIRVAANGDYYYDYKISRAGRYTLSVSYFLENRDGKESVGTIAETYIIDAAPIRQPAARPGNTGRVYRRN